MAIAPAPPVALLVENEPMVLMQAADLLKAHGFDVVEAWDAEGALRLLDEIGPVALLFTDVHLPGEVDGFAVARQVRQRWPAAAVVICSGYFLPRTDEMLEGARFIEKPFTAEMFAEAIGQHS